MGTTVRTGLRRSPRSPNRARPDAGITLVEVCAAIALLTVVVGGMVGAQAASINLTRSARQTTTAMSDLEAAMEEILLTAHDEIPSATGDYPAGVPIVKWNGLHLENETIVPEYPNMTGVTIPDPLEIRLTITWDDFRGPQSLSITTAKTK